MHLTWGAGLGNLEPLHTYKTATRQGVCNAMMCARRIPFLAFLCFWTNYSKQWFPRPIRLSASKAMHHRFRISPLKPSAKITNIIETYNDLLQIYTLFNRTVHECGHFITQKKQYLESRYWSVQCLYFFNRESCYFWNVFNGESFGLHLTRSLYVYNRVTVLLLHPLATWLVSYIQLSYN